MQRIINDPTLVVEDQPFLAAHTGGPDFRQCIGLADKRIAASEVGEIRVKGYVTVGYYRDEDKNRAADTCTTCRGCFGPTRAPATVAS